MKYAISLDHDNKIIRYKHVGKLKMQDIGMAWDDFLKMEEFTQGGYHLFSDYREAVFDMEMDEVHDIVNILDSMGPVLNGKKQAIVIEDPYSTAGSILFEQISQKKLAFMIKIFSTEPAAMKWLLK